MAANAHVDLDPLDLYERPRLALDAIITSPPSDTAPTFTFELVGVVDFFHIDPVKLEPAPDATRAHALAAVRACRRDLIEIATGDDLVSRGIARTALRRLRGIERFIREDR